MESRLDRPTMRWEFVDGMIVGVNAREITGEEWLDYCAFVEQVRFHARAIMIFSHGGGPNASQRELLRKAFRETPTPPTAVVTGSAIVRGMIAALNLFMRDVLRAFAPPDLEAAFRDLEERAGAVPRERVVTVLREMSADLGLDLPIPASRPRSAA